VISLYNEIMKYVNTLYEKMRNILMLKEASRRLPSMLKILKKRLHFWSSVK